MTSNPIKITSMESDNRTTLEENLTFGVPNDVKSDFVEVDVGETISNFPEGYIHAAHGMIYCMQKQILWDRFTQPANIMMQFRCDGNMGFPGGLLDKIYEESLVDGLNRELSEEVNLDTTKHKFVQSEHLISHVNHKKKLFLHFYAKQVTPEEFDEIEKRSVRSGDWGTETFGVVRVPLFAMNDGYRGFPVFLANQFAGNAKHQLLYAIQKHSILPAEDLDKFTKASERYISNTTERK